MLSIIIPTLNEGEQIVAALLPGAVYGLTEYARVALAEGESNWLGLVRGETATAPLVRRSVRIVEGLSPEIWHRCDVVS